MPVAKIVPNRAGSTPMASTRPCVERLGGGGEGELLDAVGPAGLLRVVEVRASGPSPSISTAGGRR